MKNTMKTIGKTALTALTAVTAFALTACGGGGGGDATTSGTTTATNTIKLCIPATFTANTFTCAKDCNVSTEYQQDFYFDTASCQTAGTQWITEYLRDDIPSTAEQASARTYLDGIRQNVGVSPLKYDSRLEEASRLHELYIGDTYTTYNLYSAHYEDNITYPSQYYRGAYGGDRAFAQGFNGNVDEVILAEFSGEYNATRSIKWLLTAIYHRQGMIANNFYRIGDGGFNTPFTAVKAQVHLLASEYDKQAFLKALSTDIGVYPYDGQVNVQTTFDNREVPDPLPNTTAYVGNPISVQLNDAKVISPTMVSFRLFIDSNNTEITDTTLLDALTDPNGRFTAYDFALFDNAPLLANTIYRAEFKYVDNGVNKTKVWRFTTGL